jgi:hypothetical protein
LVQTTGLRTLVSDISDFRGSQVNMVMDGQSLYDDPYDPGTGYAYILPELVGGTMSACWIPGEGWNRLDDDPATRLYPFAKVSPVVNLYHMMAGTTQLILSVSGATIYAQMVALADTVRAGGPFDLVVAATVSASDEILGSAETERLALNDLILGNLDGAWDAAIDLCPTPGVDLDDYEGTCFTDGTHWSATGAAVATGIAAPVILGLL